MDQPRLLLIATGGTIAGTAASALRTQGYASGALPAAALLQAVPALAGIARIEAEQPYAIDSRHLRSEHWLALARRVRDAQSDPTLDGVVVAHGTDTLEETALWLDLVCPRRLPVAVTGAMRPATAASADGPMNLLCAALVAADPASRGAGTVVVFDEQVLDPLSAAKAHTTRLGAFVARDAAPIAQVLDGRCRWREPAAQAAARRPSLATRLAVLPAALPRVDLIAAQVDGDPSIVDWALERGARGLVVAGTGHGTMAGDLQQALAAAAARGCLVVRATRLAGGAVLRNAGVDDDAHGFVAAGSVTPHKARAMTCAALAAQLDAAALQSLFDRC